jgi:hypothetical protein
VKATDVRRALDDAAGEAAALHGEAAATRTTGNPDAARRAFQVSERARARSLLDSMRVRGDARGNAQMVERGSAPAGTDGVSSGIEPLSLEEVQRALDADTTMLAYATGASRSVVWLIGHDEFSTYSDPPFRHARHRRFAAAGALRARHVGRR